MLNTDVGYRFFRHHQLQPVMLLLHELYSICSDVACLLGTTCRSFHGLETDLNLQKLDAVCAPVSWQLQPTRMTQRKQAEHMMKRYDSHHGEEPIRW